MQKKPVKDGLARHFEGWQAAVVALLVAGLGIALGTPRAVPPTEVPLPVPDARKLREFRIREAARASAMSDATDAEKTAAFDLRRLGQLVRDYGAADLAQEGTELLRTRTLLVAAAREIREKRGDEPLLRLRAFETRVFLRGLSSWEATGKIDHDAELVGGDFVSLAKRSGWVDEHGALLPDETVRTVLFHRRFGEITGLKDGAFADEIDETRALYAFWLAHPPAVFAPHGDAAAQRRTTWDWTLKKVSELGKIDASYPVLLARAVAHYNLGDANAAVEELRGHLAQKSDGPYALRARNYLVAALQAAQP